MKTVEDPKYIALQAAVGATVALMHGPVLGICDFRSSGFGALAVFFVVPYRQPASQFFKIKQASQHRRVKGQFQHSRT